MEKHTTDVAKTAQAQMLATAQKDGGKQIIGKGVRFERIRRITGYLVGTIDRFNNAKRAEVRDRVKHVSLGGGWGEDKQ